MPEFDFQPGHVAAAPEFDFQPGHVASDDVPPAQEPGLLSRIAAWATTPADAVKPIVDQQQATRGGVALGLDKGSPDWWALAHRFVSGIPGYQGAPPEAQDRLARLNAEHPVASTIAGIAGGLAQPAMLPSMTAPATAAASAAPAIVAGLPQVTKSAATSAPGVMKSIFSPAAMSGAAAVAAAGHPEAALTGFVAHAGMQVAKQYGPGVLKATVSGFDKLASIARTNPAALGRLGPVLGSAIREGPQSFAATSYALAQTDPEFQHLQQQLAEAK